MAYLRLPARALDTKLLLVGGVVVAGLWLSGAPGTWRIGATFILAVAIAAAGATRFARRYRIPRSIGDLPTSRLASANQGLVEVIGVARPAASDLTSIRPRQVWHRVIIEERTGGLWLLPGSGHWDTTHVETSEKPFAVDDGSATAIVLPHGATVLCEGRTVLEEDGRRVTREAIRPGEQIYVLGLLTSHQDSPSPQEEAERIAADWRMQPEKRDAFDSNRNGVLDADELLRLHRAAQVEARRAARRPPPGEAHVIMAPSDSNAFVISNLPPRDLFRAYTSRTFAGAAMLLAGLIVAASLWSESASLLLHSTPP